MTNCLLDYRAAQPGCYLRTRPSSGPCMNLASKLASRERAECVPSTIHVEMWGDRIRPGESIAKASSALVGEGPLTSEDRVSGSSRLARGLACGFCGHVALTSGLRRSIALLKRPSCVSAFPGDWPADGLSTTTAHV